MDGRPAPLPAGHAMRAGDAYRSGTNHACRASRPSRSVDDIYITPGDRQLRNTTYSDDFNLYAGDDIV
ncbi:hypothetical protein GDI0645 [Gluconacetobacter diazotrophicus PA1 5]|uniref:Uncharacterized protein n=1 Tax=Gluconacetobacter diazotrophicus (strain ATCC 49037 / DSM 5601 / CCUG 37298 / CIP 103539 / LMG 7603 / PAl5) TaxID=272568 RepID=A9H8Y0_GLUDA|nr:hypothetical protein GDI0645 [Gluconacetobacter diazotrophicus PA1 5]